MSSDEDVLDNEFTGFGRRVNGTCKDEESNCGPTNRGQSACCPRGMFCSGESNTVCCPTDDDCTEALLETPRCADQSWKMYNNSAPFCCSEDSVAAFKTGQDSNICADGGFQALQDDETLSEKDQDDDRGAAESSASSTSGTAVASDPGGSSKPESSDSGGSNNAGAIAGGVVGGVVAIALILLLFWFLRRRRNKKRNALGEGHQNGPHPFSLPEKDAAPSSVAATVEKDGTTREPEPNELENPEQVDLMGRYRSTSHQQPGERAELT